MKCEPLFLSRAELAEGPIWFDSALWWVDIQAGLLNRLQPETGINQSRALGEMLGAAAPSKRDGEWILALQTGFARLNWESGELTRLGNPEDKSENRFNDGKCDATGRFWAGTLNFHGKPNQAGLYRMEPDGKMHPALPEISLSNGLGWSSDNRTMFYIDTTPRHIYAFDFELTTGALSNRRILLEVPEGKGHPDGMCMDANNNLWVALWGGSCVICVDGVTGKILEQIETPAKQASSCCFGGEDLDTLFITSAWQGLSAQERRENPMAGCIFQAKPGVQGTSVHRFG